MVLIKAGKKSVKSSEAIHLLKYSRALTLLVILMARKPPIRPKTSPKSVNTGTIKVVASMRVTTRYCTGLAPDTSMASICSVTFMLPSSAPMPEPILPAHMIAVIIGPISRTIDTANDLGSMLKAPKLTRVGLSCNAKTNPIINAVVPTSIKDL